MRSSLVGHLYSVGRPTVQPCIHLYCLNLTVHHVCCSTTGHSLDWLNRQRNLGKEGERYILTMRPLDGENAVVCGTQTGNLKHPRGCCNVTHDGRMDGRKARSSPLRTTIPCSTVAGAGEACDITRTTDAPSATHTHICTYSLPKAALQGTLL